MFEINVKIILDILVGKIVGCLKIVCSKWYFFLEWNMSLGSEDLFLLYIFRFENFIRFIVFKVIVKESIKIVLKISFRINI